MRKGEEPGGKIATPIRNMLNDKKHDAVTFVCDDAEITRQAALILKRRCGYSYRTRKRDNELTVYCCGRDDIPKTTYVDIRKQNEARR